MWSYQGYDDENRLPVTIGNRRVCKFQVTFGSGISVIREGDQAQALRIGVWVAASAVCQCVLANARTNISWLRRKTMQAVSSLTEADWGTPPTGEADNEILMGRRHLEEQGTCGELPVMGRSLSPVGLI